VKRECARLPNTTSSSASSSQTLRISDSFYIGTDSGIMFKYPNAVTQSGYDPRERVWYKGAATLKDKDSVYWTEPYNSASAEGETHHNISKAVFDSREISAESSARTSAWIQ
jgi:hypothetical protein